MKCFKLLLIALISVFFVSNYSMASEESLFTAEIVSQYEFGPYTYASVNHAITLKSVQGEYAPTQYELNLSDNNLIDAIAETDGKAIDAEFNSNSVKVNLPENLQNSKEIKFNLKYKSETVVSKQGLVHTVIVPVITGNTQTENSNNSVTLLVPSQWGPLQSSSVKIESESDVDGLRQINYRFDNNNVPNHIRAIFGEYQLYQATLTYHLQNLSEKVESLAITFPPNSDPIQTVYVTSIDPKPNEIVKDDDGNILGYYLVKPGKKIDVVFRGVIKIDVSKGSAIKANDGPINVVTYTMADQNWEVNAPEIQELATSLETTANIYKYVVNNLIYDYNMVNAEGAQRKGALQALQSKTSAVCMDFTDLTIALMRSAGIPAREVNGYALVNLDNKDDIKTDVLHAWVQYYDENRGWVNIDPTWESITGFDYFNEFDTEHVTLAIKGITSQKPQPVGVYRDASFEGRDIEIVPTTEIDSASVDALGWIDRFNYDQLNIFEKFWLWLSGLFK